MSKNQITSRFSKEEKKQISNFLKIGETKYEEIKHPAHYNGLPNGIECWDVIEHFPGNISAAIKYLWRAGLKPGQDTVKDLKKCLEYTQRQINLLEGKNPKMNKH